MTLLTYYDIKRAEAKAKGKYAEAEKYRKLIEKLLSI